VADTIREIVGVFHDAGALRKAADELMVGGFDRSELSMLGSRKTVEEKLGSASQGAANLEDNPRVPMQAYMGTDSLTEAKGLIVGVPAFIGVCAAAAPAIAHGASMTMVIVWAVIGAIAGLILGTVTMKTIGNKTSAYLQGQIKSGGILLWVRTATPDKEKKASEIMKGAGAADVHVHDRPVIEDWGFVYGYLDWLAGDKRPG
jgi:hypothetical protein